MFTLSPLSCLSITDNQDPEKRISKTLLSSGFQFCQLGWGHSGDMWTREKLLSSHFVFEWQDNSSNRASGTNSSGAGSQWNEGLVQLSTAPGIWVGETLGLLYCLSSSWAGGNSFCTYQIWATIFSPPCSSSLAGTLVNQFLHSTSFLEKYLVSGTLTDTEWSVRLEEIQDSMCSGSRAEYGFQGGRSDWLCEMRQAVHGQKRWRMDHWIELLDDCRDLQNN